MSKINFKWVVGGTAGIGLIATALYVYFSTHPLSSDFPIIKLIISTSIALGVVSIFIGLAPWIKSLLRNSNIGDKPKDVVGTSEAFKIWQTAFIENNRIPSRISGDHKVPLRDKALRYRNTQPFVKGASRFWMFECWIAEGDRTGSLMVVIPLEHQNDAKKNIKDNWNSFIRDDDTHSSFKLEDGKYPLTTQQAHQSDLNLKRVELEDAGYSPEDAKDLAGVGLFNQQQPIQSRRNKRIPNKAQDMFPDFNGTPEFEPEITTDDIQDDINAYAASKK